MVAGVPLIDLDRTPPGVPAVALPRPRPFLLLAALTAVLLALGGSAATSPGLTPVLSAGPGVTAFQLGGGFFFAAGSGTVRGYDLRGGSAGWTRPFPQDVQNLEYDAGARVLLALAGQDPRLTAMDAGSGRTLWTDAARDTLVIGVAGGAVLTRFDPAVGATRLRSVDLRTGRVIWTRAVDFDGYLGPDELFTAGDSTRIVLVDPGGVTVLRFADGAILARGSLGTRSAPAPDRSAPAGSVLGGSRQLGGLVLRSDPAVPGRTWVSAPERRTAVVRTLGALDGVASLRCVVDAPYLACPTRAGATGVWRIG